MPLLLVIRAMADPVMVGARHRPTSEITSISMERKGRTSLLWTILEWPLGTSHRCGIRGTCMDSKGAPCIPHGTSIQYSITRMRLRNTPYRRYLPV